MGCAAAPVILIRSRDPGAALRPIATQGRSYIPYTASIGRFCPPNLFAKVWIKCWRMAAALVWRDLQAFDQKTISTIPAFACKARQHPADFAHNRC